MSQQPTDLEFNLSYEPVRNIQFNVFLDNRVGKLYELLSVFEDKALVVAGLSVIDTSDCAIARVLTSRSELARRLLDRAKLPFNETPVIVVEVPKGHTLSELCRALLSAELSIRYVYPLLVFPHSRSAVAVQCDDPMLAAEILLKKGFVLLGENDLGENLNPGGLE